MRISIIILPVPVVVSEIKALTAVRGEFTGLILVKPEGIDATYPLITIYNYPQKLDRAIRCMLACKNIEEARRDAQSAEAT
jgi:hypothetical protein